MRTSEPVELPDHIVRDVNRPFIFAVTEYSTRAQIFLGFIRNL